MKNVLDDKTFILGIGAQKAGTTWLHDFFRNHGEVFVPQMKEMHYFDQVYRPDLCSYFGGQFAASLARQLSTLTDKNQLKERPVIAELFDRVRMNEEGAPAYVDFFQKRVPADVNHFGEITPSYSLIRETGLRAIKDVFPKIKIIFLLRDPIDRYHSALRMYERGGKINANQEFQRSLYEPFHFERGRYDLTIGSVLKVFDEQDVFFGFYETLFTEKEVRRLCNFLGIGYAEPDFSRQFNVGAPSRPLTEQDLQMAHEAYAPVYEFCKSFFGSDIPASWRC
jgi:hypothetical protein